MSPTTSHPRRRPRPRVALLTVALLAGCGGGAPDPRTEPAAASWSGLRVTGQTQAGFRVAERLDPLEGNDWYLEGAGREAFMHGEVGHLDLWVGQPADLELALDLRRVGFLPDLPVGIQVNGHEVGEVTVAEGGAPPSIEVPVEALVPGTNRVRLTTTGSGRPVDHVEGAGDTRTLSLRLGGVDTGLEGPDRPPAVASLPLELEPGAGVSLATLPAEGAELVVRARAPRGGALHLGLRDVAADETLDWTEHALSSEVGEIRLEVGVLSDRPVEVSLAADAAGGAVTLEAVELTRRREAADAILIVVDTLRADHFDGTGLDVARPAFERLMEDGVHFPVAMAHAPMTLPSHTALFSARYPHVSGVTNNWQDVPTEVPLAADWLAACGYETRASISLGTLWTPRRGGGLERGFERYLSTTDMLRAPAVNERVLPLLEDLDPARPSFLFAHYCDPHEPYNSRRYGPRYCELTAPGADGLRLLLNQWTETSVAIDAGAGDEVVVESPHRFKLRRLTAFDADGGRVPVEFVEGDEGRPGERFVVRIGGSGAARLDLWVHDLAETPDEAVDRYGEEVAYADAYVGRLLDALDELGLYEDSLVIFTSDHGEQLFEHGHLGHARDLYAPEIRVPLVIKPPADDAEGRERLRRAAGGLARHVDVVPTLLDLLGLPPLPGQMGVSLLDRDAPRLHVAETYRPESPRDLLMQTDGRHKLIFAPQTDSFELYDLVADASEESDLWDARGPEFEEWAQTLRLIAEGGADGLDVSELDESELRRLRALGYITGDDDVPAPDAAGPTGAAPDEPSGAGVDADGAGTR